MAMWHDKNIQLSLIGAQSRALTAFGQMESRGVWHLAGQIVKVFSAAFQAVKPGAFPAV